MAEAIGYYILSQRKPDGDFVHSRYLASGKNTGFVSHYYTGEALLGLFCLSNISGDMKLVGSSTGVPFTVDGSRIRRGRT